VTFDELPLYQAVHKVYSRVERPGSDDWISRHAASAYKHVLMQIVEDEAWTDQGIPYSLERVVEVWRELRKVPRARLKCEVSLAHGGVCFFANRGLGACSSDVDLDRIIPESRGGTYCVENCVLVCSHHNRARGNRSVEDFLRSESATSAAGGSLEEPPADP
jgi:hypothetical protein